MDGIFKHNLLHYKIFWILQQPIRLKSFHTVSVVLNDQNNQNSFSAHQCISQMSIKMTSIFVNDCKLIKNYRLIGSKQVYKTFHISIWILQCYKTFDDKQKMSTNKIYISFQNRMKQENKHNQLSNLIDTHSDSRSIKYIQIQTHTYPNTHIHV